MDFNTMVVAVTGQICGTAFLVAVLSLWFRRRRGTLVDASNSELTRRFESRLVDMQRSIDSIAVEVERVSEGQRFTTRLLSERDAVPTASLPSSSSRDSR